MCTSAVNEVQSFMIAGVSALWTSQKMWGKMLQTTVVCLINFCHAHYGALKQMGCCYYFFVCAPFSLVLHNLQMLMLLYSVVQHVIDNILSYYVVLIL